MIIKNISSKPVHVKTLKGELTLPVGASMEGLTPVNIEDIKESVEVKHNLTEVMHHVDQKDLSEIEFKVDKKQLND